MTDQNEWYRVLTLSRSNAAQNLRFSNDLLSTVDELIRASEKGELTDEKVSEIAKELVQISMQLTDKSKEMSVAVSRLVGVL